MRLTSLNQLMLGREVVEGTWRLTRAHRLEYRRRRRGNEEEIVVTADLIQPEANGLVIGIRESSEDGESSGRKLTLRGRWQADASNRLSFEVEREGGRQDLLTFEGAWEVDPGYQILYRFRQASLKTKSSEIHTLRFQGFWDLDQARRFTYVLDRDSDSAFRFRGTFQTPTVLAKTGQIRYQLGIEAEGKHRVQTVTLFGKWKISRDLGLEFEMAYQEGGNRTMNFKATYAVDARNALAARLTTREGKPLGMEILFTHEFLKGQGAAFLRLRKSVEDSAVEGGMRLRW